jgi:hypothetical protein
MSAPLQIGLLSARQRDGIAILDESDPNPWRRPREGSSPSVRTIADHGPGCDGALRYLDPSVWLLE